MTTPDPIHPASGDLAPHVLEAIAHNLCSLHDFDPAFVMANKAFALAAITEYRRARTSEWRCDKCGAAADERYDCCEVHAATANPPATAAGLGEAVGVATIAPDMHFATVNHQIVGDAYGTASEAWASLKSAHDRLITTPASHDALIARVREVLEPFAKAAGTLDGHWSSDDWRWNDSTRSNVTVGDIRAVRALLTDLDARDGG